MTIPTTTKDSAAAQTAILAWPVEAFQNATTACLSAIEHSAGMQSEWQNFIKQRLEKDEDYPGKLLQCKTPTDFLQVQFNFVNDFFKDYTKEFQRMGEMMRDAANESIHAAQKTGSGTTSPAP
jgi:hypothetical protein